MKKNSVFFLLFSLFISISWLYLCCLLVTASVNKQIGSHFGWRYAFWVESVLMIPFVIMGFTMKPLHMRTSFVFGLDKDTRFIIKRCPDWWLLGLLQTEILWSQICRSWPRREGYICKTVKLNIEHLIRHHSKTQCCYQKLHR